MRFVHLLDCLVGYIKHTSKQFKYLKPYSYFVYFACRLESQDHRGHCSEVNLGKPVTAVRNHQNCHSSHFNSQQESDLWCLEREIERERDEEKNGEKRMNREQGDIKIERKRRNKMNRQRS